METRRDARKHTLASMVAMACALGAATRADAVEGALGRPITGMQITSFAGVVPPEAGFIWELAYIHYQGEIGGGKQTPVGGQLALGLDATFDLAALAGVYVWDTPRGRWNFASELTVPYAWVDAGATTVVGPFTSSLDDYDAGLFDITVAPIIASYHVSQMEHWSFGLYVDAPTGSYDTGKLANVSLNNWTFKPTVGYTKLWLKGGLELSLLSAVEFYTENPATDYQNGEVFRTDAILMLRTPKGFGFGMVGGWIEQISDDSAPNLPASLDGFRGHSLGAGPAFTYSHHFADKSEFDMNFRWVWEFDVENRFEGDGGQLTFSYHH